MNDKYWEVLMEIYAQFPDISWSKAHKVTKAIIQTFNEGEA